MSLAMGFLCLTIAQFQPDLANFDWAARYVGTTEKQHFAIRLAGRRRHYAISGFCTDAIGKYWPVKGVFEAKRATLRLHCHGQRWTGSWVLHRGCFELSSRSKSKFNLWQELPPVTLDFLAGHQPLEPPHDVPDNFFGGETERESVYAFPADLAVVIAAADKELLAAHWAKGVGQGLGYDKRKANQVWYSEPGPAGRSICIDPDSDPPDTSGASDLIWEGTYRKGWVGITVTGPKVHG